MQEFLTTRELADLLRIKERKVYDLVSEGVIPVSRVTGKLLFPRATVEAWIRRNTELGAGQAALSEHEPVVAGSHDPLLEWALRQSGSGLASYFDGSADGLERLAQGRAVAAGIHFSAEPGVSGNGQAIVSAAAGEPLVAIEWARRQQGLVVQRGNPRGIEGVADLAGLTVARRQQGAGSFGLLAMLIAREAGLEGRIAFLDEPARSHFDVAQAVTAGRADAGLAIEAVARISKLDFVPLVTERYDLVFWRRDFFEPPAQALLAVMRSKAFPRQAAELGGYDISEAGTVRYNGP